MFTFLTFLFFLLLFFFFLRQYFRLKREKELILMQIAHELRAPLTILQGYAESLRHLGKLSSSQIKEIGKQILLSSERMDRIVSVFMTLARLEKEEKAEPVCDLSKSIKKCQELLLSAHPKVHLFIPEKLDSSLVCMEESLFEIVLMNLLENAVRYSGEGKKIQISCIEKEKKLLLCVADEGIGMRASHLPYIFRCFYSVNPRMSRKMGGAGLGLFIVKKILDKYHATISVQSKENEGTTFSLLLPKCKALGKKDS